MGMTCAERVQMAAGGAHSSFVTSKVRNLTKRAGLRYPEADVRSIDFSEERGLDRLLVTELSTCGFAERKLTRKYAAFQVLVLDEWLLDRPGELFRGFLLELMEARYGSCSTVLCTQFRQKDWHARLGGGVHADAIMDRIVHGTAWVEMGELNMRRKLGSGSG